MSAKGIFWLSRLSAEGIKNGAFRVLFHLAQSHSDDKDPRIACFPSQATLMKRSGLSNGSLNNALNDLEEAGFIRRRRTTIKGTAKQRTFYILGCDFPMLDHLPEDIDEDGFIDEIANSTRLEFAPTKLQKSEEQTPKKGGSKLQPAGEDNIKDNINTTTAAVEIASATGSEQQQGCSEGFYADLLQTLHVQPEGWWAPKKGLAHVRKWLDAGLTEDQILSAARANASAFAVPPDGPKALDTAMRAELAKAPAGAAPASAGDWFASMAEKIKTLAYVHPSAVTIQRANELLKRGLVGTDDLRRHGIAFTL